MPYLSIPQVDSAILGIVNFTAGDTGALRRAHCFKGHSYYSLFMFHSKWTVAFALNVSS